MDKMAAALPVKKSAYLNGRRKYKLALFIIALCCFAHVFIFNYAPLAGWSYAFFRYRLGRKLFDTPFAGFKNFIYAVSDPDFRNVIRNTLVLSFLGICVSWVAPLFAIMMSEMRSTKYRRIVQTLTTLPHFVSWVIVFAVFYVMFTPLGGFINVILDKLGLIKTPINPLANPNIVWPLHTAIGLWKGVGYGAIIYFATIAGIDPELYEAARIDGANRFHCIRYITIPGILPMYANLLILAMGNVLSNSFEHYYLFYNPMVHNNIQTLELYTYRIAMVISPGDYSLSTAIGMSKTLISIMLFILANIISKKLRGRSIF